MKKIIIFISIFITSVYLSGAIDIVLNSGQKLDSSSWTDLSSVLNKIDVDNNDLKINGRLAVDGKICDTNNKCIGECEENYHWDTSINNCVINAGTETNPGASCLDLYNKGERENKAYFLTGKSGNKFQVYCDMTTDIGGRTLIAKVGHAYHSIGTRVTPTNTTELAKFKSLSAETPAGTLVNEFIDSSTLIRFKMPKLDEAFIISKVQKNDNTGLGNRSVGNDWNLQDITLISGKKKHSWVTMTFNNECGVYDYTSYQPPVYGTRGGQQSLETGPAYVFFR